MVNAELKNAIVYHMVKELTTLKYGYQSIVEGCFDASQQYNNLIVPTEQVEQMRKVCVEEATKALQRLYA